jgi:hypothetical protein
MQLQGAVIIIGSLFWEDDTNCIDLKEPTELAKSRKVWRDLKLNMDLGKLVSLPIKYGRKSTSRFCTYTMAFANSAEKKGKGYVVPYKEKINIEENFNQLYCQAIELARIEGISKSGENTLVKKWGSVGLKLNPKFLNENQEVANNLLNYWKQYYSKLEIELYRINDNEECSITKDGLLNFEFEESLEDIEYFLATPVSPNVKKYPDGQEIANAMNSTREEYYGYFVGNYNNRIVTENDEKIINDLPEKIKASLRQDS